MADSTTAPNNKPVSFGVKKPAREPAGITNAAPIKKPSKALRKNANRAIKRGMISPKAAKKHLGDY